MDRRSWLGAAGTGVLGASVGGLASPSSSLVRPEGLSATWIQGTAFEAEDAAALTAVQRVGWGSVFSGRPGKFTWFHIAIPTPVIVEDVRPRLERVFVFYRTDGAEIRNVHVYDGPRKVKAFDGLHLSGDRSGGLSALNTWSFSPPLSYRFSIGISVGVQFSIGFDSPVTTNILFTSAGADLRFPPSLRPGTSAVGSAIERYPQVKP